VPIHHFKVLKVFKIFKTATQNKKNVSIQVKDIMISLKEDLK